MEENIGCNPQGASNTDSLILEDRSVSCLVLSLCNVVKRVPMHKDDGHPWTEGI